LVPGIIRDSHLLLLDISGLIIYIPYNNFRGSGGASPTLRTVGLAKLQKY
jgi:hypothetical protein